MTNSNIDYPFDVLLAYPDNPIFSAVKSILSTTSRRLITVESARDAVNCLARYRINLLVANAELIDTDGLRLIHLVRTGRFAPKTLPAIVLCEEWQWPYFESLARSKDAYPLTTSQVERLPQVAAELIANYAQHRATTLVIEDDEVTASGIRDSLDGIYDLEFAYDGPTGLAAWEARHHTLILLDLKLPGLSGRDILRRIITSKPSQAIVVITAHASDQNCLDLMLEGAKEFISKPFVGRQLREACAKALPYTAYLNQCSEIQREQEMLAELKNRIRTAHYYLSSGLAGQAAQHLRHAQIRGDIPPFTDDEWIDLLDRTPKPTLK